MDRLNDYDESDFADDEYFDGEDLDNDALYELHDLEEYEFISFSEEEE